jgi:isoamylase
MPLGATVDDGGVNFALFSEQATGVELLLFDSHNETHPVATIPFDPALNRSFHFWHMYIRGLKAGYHYAFRVSGPTDPGYRFDAQKVLLDPYAKGNTNTLWKPVDACVPGDNLESSMRAVIVDGRGYDWEGDAPLKLPMSDTIVYEMHVRGFTKSDTSGVEHPGTFSGMIEKIPYLQALGVTAVELLPVFAFDEREVRGINPIDGSELRNFWGYDPYLHFAPQASYCLNPEEGSQITEFRDMVKALHKAGIEVILDVVFNHTGEGNHMGPTIAFKGLGNDAYYLLHPTWTTRAAATPSTRTIRSSRSSSSTACTTGSRRCTSTASGSTRDRCCTGVATGRRWSSRRSSGGSSSRRSSPTRR